MDIDSLRFNTGIFGTNVKPTNINGGGASVTPPVVQESYKAPVVQPQKTTIEDMERILAFYEGDFNIDSFSSTSQINETKGSAWDKFPTFVQNDSRELIPVIAGREDELGLMKDFQA